MNVTAKQGIRIMVADRASGLCVLMFTLMGCLLKLDLSSIPYAVPLIVLGLLVTLAGYLGFSWILLKQRPLVMLESLPFSLMAQAFWMAGLLTIWAGLGNGAHAVEYIILYCAASITGMLPVSVGGLGIKEMTYFYGANLMTQYAHTSVDGDAGVALSLCIFFLTFVTSLPGLLWLNRVEKADFL